MIMVSPAHLQETHSKRVRAILLTGNNEVLFIKRIKPHKPQPYWVAPGGGVEAEDEDIFAALHRELYEELGAEAQVIAPAFLLQHEKAGKQLEEHFFVCQLLNYDLSQRHGPEFDDPSRGHYIPDAVLLTPKAIKALNILTPELQTWLLKHLAYLRSL